MEATILNDRTFKGAAGLAARGWKLVRLYGVTADGRCTCGKPGCATPGKHPEGGPEWQHRATDDEQTIASWFDSEEPVNIGVRLGAASGVVDVEFDSPEAEEVLKRFGLDRIDTPAYSSGRGVHRLFRFESWLPDAGVVKVDGLEVRIGGGEKAIQSVIPPSWHWSGKRYQWLPGRSPEDVELARLPEEFKGAILANGKPGSGCVQRAREAMAGQEPIREGGRHDFLLGVASDLTFNERNLDAEGVEQRLFGLVQGMNVTRCSPPKGQEEVARIVADQIAFYKESRAAGRGDLRSDDPKARQIVAASKDRWVTFGLENNGGRWSPGQWRLVVVHSDPRHYRLVIPNPSGSEPFAVTLTADEYQNPDKVARRVMEATGIINLLDPTRAKWVKAWAGHNLEEKPGVWVPIRGLQGQLLDDDFRSEDVIRRAKTDHSSAPKTGHRVGG
ncbi:MAG: bifunctional DNA primase/polymerase, partial [Planctomycetes bacterium]|nr:bifunctional DNA primase/polymerase [Planctomycetota bacterium]